MNKKNIKTKNNGHHHPLSSLKGIVLVKIPANATCCDILCIMYLVF